MFLGKKVEKWVHAHPNNKAVHQLTQYGIFQCSKEMKSKTKRAFIAVSHTSQWCISPGEIWTWEK